MAETKRTPEAVRAANEIDRQIARQGDYTIEHMTAIIDRLTGLPEIAAERDRLKAINAELVEACEAALRFQEAIDMDGLPEAIHGDGAPLTVMLRAAIAKSEPPAK